MDKNTITGLMLMAAIFFGFLWLNTPTEEEIAAERERQEQIRKDAEAINKAADQSTYTFTQNDSIALVKAVRAIGTASSETEKTFSNSDFRLSVDSINGINGVAIIDNAEFDIRELLANRSNLTLGQSAEASQNMHALINNALKYQGFARFLSGTDSVTVLENDLVKVSISSRGGMVSQVELKKHTSEVGGETHNVKLFVSDSDKYGFCFNTYDQRIDTREFNFTPTLEGDSAILMALHPDENSLWGIRYTLAPDNYVVKMEIVQKGMGTILPANTTSMDFSWHQKMGRNELGRTFEERNSGIVYKFEGEDPEELNSVDDDKESLNGQIKWVSFKNQFFSSAIIARDHFTSTELTSLNTKTDDCLKEMTMQATLPYNVNDGTAASFDFYFGPNSYPILSDLDDYLNDGNSLSMTHLIPLGWGLFRWINTIVIIPVFTFLGSFISNYGLIIFLLTIFIKLIIFPFTFKSYKSQARMRVLAPEIKEINDKYPNQEDAMKRQQETMALYSRAGASPFSGCLPLLLQMPILIAMFSFFPSAIELRGQSFLWANDLSAPDSILNLPFNIPFYGSHVSLFCLLMTIVNIVYMRINMQNQPGGASMPGMKMMNYIMPVMFLFIFNDYASGLSYYYLLSLLITIIQTWIFRRMINEDKVRAELLANAKKPRKKTGFMARLEEAQRQQQAAMRQQQNGGSGKRRR